VQVRSLEKRVWDGEGVQGMLLAPAPVEEKDESKIGGGGRKQLHLRCSPNLQIRSFVQRDFAAGVKLRILY
jgi:hypothetical protein